MKALRRSIAIIIALMMFIAIFAGCDTKKATEEETTKATEEKTTETVQTTEESTEEGISESTLISEEPITLTVHLHTASHHWPVEGVPVFDIVEKLTNIKLKNISPETATDSIEVYNLMLVSGDLPDIIGLPFYSGQEAYYRDALDGVYDALDDLIVENAPNIQKVFAENRDVETYYRAADGQLYGIPFFYDYNALEGMGFFIRNDWLGKLDMETPTTLDEYYNVLMAFRDDDPNGNGENDEIPFFTRYSNLNHVLILWNAYASFYDDNGAVKFGPAEPNFKEAYINLSKWYSEGLIDPEFYTTGAASREKLLSENKGGSSFDWFASTSSYNTSLEDKIEGFEFKVMAPPAGVDGVIRNPFKRDVLAGGNAILGWAMSSTNKYPVETVKYFDYWFTEEGRMLQNFGVEGEDYIVADNGEIEFTDSVMKAEMPPLDVLRSHGAQSVLATVQDIRYELAVMHPLGREGFYLYSENDLSSTSGSMPLLTFSDEDNETTSTILANVNTYVSEMTQKWILGILSVEDSYDEFLATIKEFGIDEVVDIKQKAYDDLND